ncbi:MAG: hypothetical protein P4L53_26595 [Candidatus Obscuribacterales bacterium]|nr:hypothetical protein [Candidatus Obscuribacterales bacterium]
MSRNFSWCNRCILFIVAIAISGGCSAPHEPIKQQITEKEFWQWFQTHEAQLYRSKYGSDHIFAELNQKINGVSPNLTYEVSLQPAAGTT